MTAEVKNYMSVWNKWAAVKAGIVAEHERVKPLIMSIIAEIKAISAQNIDGKNMLEIEGLKIKFFPSWNGWAYTYATGWDQDPNPTIHWEWTLAEAEAVWKFMKGLQEEEIKTLFRLWSELPAKRY